MTVQIRVWLVSFLLWMPVLPTTLAQEPQFVYVPPSDVKRVQQSVLEFNKQRTPKDSPFFFVTKGGLSVASERTYVDWRWEDQGIVLTIKRGPAVPLQFDYAAMPPFGVVTDTVLGASFYGVRLDSDWTVWVEPRDSDRKIGWAKWIADMFALQFALVKGRAEFEKKFRDALANYPATESRPPLPEEARRFKVQAEAAVTRKDFNQATVNYIEALQAAPWWSEGYFNVALLYAELKNVEGAIRNMKRFLLLEPKHAKAREAQDQIYRWEGELRAAR